MDIPIMEVPKNCRECKATCPLSRDDCPYDLYQQAKALQAKVNDAGLTMPGYDGLLGNLVQRSKECWKEVAAEVEADNKETRGAMRLLQRMGHLLPLREQPAPVVQLRSKQSAPVEEDEDEGSEPAPEAASRGNRDLYVDEEDAALEEEILQQDGVHGISVAPKKRIDTLPEYVEKVLRPAFSQAPFQGLVAVIPKRHDGSTTLCRVTAYYRGPPPKEGLAIWKERKQTAE